MYMEAKTGITVLQTKREKERDPNIATNFSNRSVLKRVLNDEHKDLN